MDRAPAPRILLLAASVSAALSPLVGCVPKVRPGFDAVAPNARLDAIVAAADASDRASLEKLVEQLDSGDDATRMLAIRALERRTGTTLGYEHDAPIWQRREAVNRWVERLAEADLAARTAAEGTTP